MSDLSTPLSRLKALAAKATPGPWRVMLYGPSPDEAAPVSVSGAECGVVPSKTCSWNATPENLAHIAACSPGVIAALVAVVETTTPVIEAYEQLLLAHRLGSHTHGDRALTAMEKAKPRYKSALADLQAVLTPRS